MPVFFAGQVQQAGRLPWFYLPWTLLIQLPELVLVGLALSSVAALSPRLRCVLVPDRSRRLWLLAAFSSLFPIAYVIARHPPLYNGCRLFLFVIPPLCALAGASLAQFISELRLRSRFGFLVVTLALTLELGHHLSLLTALHPYQYLFYNRLIGGVRGADERYELDYYCHSYAEAARQLTAELRDRDSEQFASRTYAIYTADHPFSS